MASFSFTFDTPTNPWTINHSLGDSFPYWAIYDSSGEFILPTSAVATSADVFTFTFDEAITGAGSILSVLDLVSFASTQSFTDLATVKSCLGLAATDPSEDIKLARLIAGVSEGMKSYMRRNIVETAHTDETHNGQGMNALTLKQYPVVAASGVVITIDDVVLDASDYVVDNDTAIVRKASEGSRFPSGAGNLKVTYVSGSTDGVPQDLNLATVKQVLYERRLQSNGHQISMSTANVPGVYFEVYRTTEWAQGVQETMDRYRQASVA